MKIMIASDIHGSLYWCEHVLEHFQFEKAERLILLGDLLYHGPRNPLPEVYDPRVVSERLNTLTGRVFSVRGNCDSEVDQLLINFPMMADYALLPIGSSTAFITHGHQFNSDNPPPIIEGDVLLHGHSHIPALKKLGSCYYVNPGSASLPKEDSQNSYIMLEGTVFTLKSLENGEVLGELDISGGR